MKSPTRILTLTLFLGGCASMSMRGAAVTDVVVSDSKFRVFMASGSNRVEAQRISFEMLPSRSLTLVNAERAIEIATGCNVDGRTSSGDQAIIKAKVDCILP